MLYRYYLELPWKTYELALRKWQILIIEILRQLIYPLAALVFLFVLVIYGPVLAILLREGNMGTIILTTILLVFAAAALGLIAGLEIKERQQEKRRKINEISLAGIVAKSNIRGKR